MRIGFFQRDLPPQKYGGVARQVHLLANALCELGHEVTMFTLSPRPPDALYQWRPVAMPGRLRRWSTAERHLLGYFFRKTDTSAFDVIHTHGDNFLMDRPTPQVRTFYGSALGEALHARSVARCLSQLVFWGLEIAGALNADVNTAISAATRKYIPWIRHVVPCGVDLRKFCPSGEKTGRPSILFVGDLHTRKRGDFMLRLFKGVRDRFPDAALFMVTPEPCAGPGVTHYGRVSDPDLIALYRKAWVLCAPSTYEGFGLPLVEAMACGTPAAASPNHGSREILGQGRGGAIAGDRDMGGVLERLIAENSFRQALSEGALKRARDYDIFKIAGEYLDIYHALAEK
jgi:glycosyltransferase involved in cell wall biosynthesis